MIVIDGSILVSPYLEAIVRDIEPTEIVVPLPFKNDVLTTGELFRTLTGFYEADDRIAWSTFRWAQSRIKDWVDTSDERSGGLFAAGANRLYEPLWRAIQNSNPDLNLPVAKFIADELVDAIGLAAPIVAMGEPQSATWSVIENTFGEAGQCTVLNLTPEEKRETLEELNLSLAAIAGLDLCLIEVVAPLPLAQEDPLAALGQCRFVLIDP